MGKPLAAIGASLVLALGAAGIATASHTDATRIQTIVGIDSYVNASRSFSGSLGGFEGKQCFRNRRITLYVRTPDGFRRIGRTRTTRSGRFQITITPAPGNYFVVASKRLLPSSDGHRDLCRRDRSDDFLLTADLLV